VHPIVAAAVEHRTEVVEEDTAVEAVAFHTVDVEQGTEVVEEAEHIFQEEEADFRKDHVPAAEADFHKDHHAQEGVHHYCNCQNLHRDLHHGQGLLCAGSHHGHVVEPTILYEFHHEQASAGSGWEMIS